MSNITTIYVDNDNELDIVGLRNDQTGADLNNAVVSIHLRDAAGADVAGETWPMLVAYVAGSQGIYRATLPYTLPLAPGGRYVATVVADAGPGLRAEWKVECVARIRN